MNSLAQIFSDEEVEFTGKIRFKNVESKREFIKKLKQSIESQIPFRSGAGYLTKNELDEPYYYPLFRAKEETPSKVEYEDKNLVLLLKNGRKVVFKRKKENRNVLHTQINNVTLTFDLSEDDDDFDFTYDINFDKPIKTSQALYAVETTLLLFKHILGLSKRNFTRQPRSIRKVYNFFFSFYLAFFALKEIEEVTNKTFKIDNTFDIGTDLETIITLHTYLVEQKPLKKPSIIVKDLNFSNEEPSFRSKPVKGQFNELLLPSESKEIHLLGQSIVLLFLDFIGNVLIRDIKKIGRQKSFIIDEVSSKPMYFVTQAFLEKVDLKEKAGVDLIEKLESAQEWSYYYDRLYKRLENQIFS